MTLDNTATHIYCQTCATAWELMDENTGYYFRSASFDIGSYASPKQIADAAEEMTFCPSCDVTPLADSYKKPGPGIQESPFYRGASRMEGETEAEVRTRQAELDHDTGADPDVTHQP